jgi:hypothetical protein
MLREVFGRIEELLTAYAKAPEPSATNVVQVKPRFK